MSWKIIAHTADAGLEVSARSWNELFSLAAEGFYHLCLDGAPAPSLQGADGDPHVISIDAVDLEELAVSWLNELLFLLETRYVLFAPSSLSVSDTEATLTAEGVLIPSNHDRIAVKAATYGGIEVNADPSPFLRVFLDM
ncbi:MAG: archease [Synergistaceae bacterium]|nr:archease [Synergistota bacterium]NLM71047.1 archease [Synergistaceae bacterium]